VTLLPSRSRRSALASTSLDAASDDGCATWSGELRGVRQPRIRTLAVLVVPSDAFRGLR